MPPRGSDPLLYRINRHDRNTTSSGTQPPLIPHAYDEYEESGVPHHL